MRSARIASSAGAVLLCVLMLCSCAMPGELYVVGSKGDSSQKISTPVEDSGATDKGKVPESGDETAESGGGVADGAVPKTDDTPAADTTQEPQDGHSHYFRAATCSKPKTCTICGETKGEPLEHKYTDVTCTAPKTCSVCGATDGVTAEHSWVDATCTAPRTCSVCGATEGATAEHSWVDATCTTPKTCSVCGATVGTAAEHNWKDADYTVPKTCTLCGKIDGYPLDVPGKSNYHGHVYTGGPSSKKYHYEASCPGKNSHEITWDEVESRNLGPCGTCVLK